jgi:hypothetical protein
VRLVVDETTLDIKGIARVRRGTGVTVAVYQGVAGVNATGRNMPGGLHALRQLTVPATGVLPRQVEPLAYDERAPDPWDLRYLADAIDLGTQLERRSRAVTQRLGGADAARSDVGGLLPALRAEPAFGPALVTPTLAVGETVVGASIALEASANDDFAATWGDVFSFRADGATWGLVAADQAAKREALLARLDGVLGRTARVVRPGPGAGPTTTTTTTPRPPSGPPPTPPPTTPPRTPPTIPPVGGPAQPAVDLVNDLLDSILGG